MGKRISNFTKEFENLENNKVIEILEKNGVANKKAQSNISEEEEAMVIKILASMGITKTGAGKDQDEKEKAAPAAKEKKAPASPKADAGKTADKADAGKETVGAAQAKKEEPAKEQPAKEEPAKEERAKEVPVKEEPSKAGTGKTDAPKSGNAKEEPVKAEAAKNTEGNRPQTAEPKVRPVSPDGRKMAENRPPLKKKSVIIMSSSNDSHGGRNVQRGGQGDRRNGSGAYHSNQGGNRFTRPNGPIKPRENLIDRAAEVTNRRLQAEREEMLRRQAEEERIKMESAAKEEAEAPENRENVRNVGPAPAAGYNRMERGAGARNMDMQRSDRNIGMRPERQGGQRPGADRFGAARPSGGRAGDGMARRDGQGGRFDAGRTGKDQKFAGARPGQKPGGKTFVADSSFPENDKHQERRNSGKDRDSRSKKDLIYEEDNEMLLGRGRNSKAGRFIKPVKTKEEVVEDDIKVITLPETVTIKELADKMKIQPSVIVKKLFMKGEMVTVNQEIPFEKAEEIALEYEIMCEQEEKVDIIAELLKEEDEPEEKLKERPPVICVMGHVDHGKTSLLDAIRKTNVTDREAGGITQHIGAYTVNVNGKQITFLDTPGHEAFTSMRMRGANSTDIAILVVAADDGVMPQTVEAINHAKAAGIEILVAVNKIDKPGANIDRVKQELTEYELLAEDWGGTTVFVPVSAKTGQGIEDLLEMILLQAEVLELKANPNRRARGLVIEAELDKGRGPVATILVQKGTLRVGDFISAGASHGKVRAMVDDKGRRVKEALPSQPVEILGLNDVPNAGEIFICHGNDKEAKSYAETFIAQNKAKLLEDTKGKMSLDDLYSKIHEGNLKELNLIIKADVQGSVEAVKQSMLKLSNEEVVVKVIHGGVGAINESDVILASASSAIIIGFNVRPDVMAKQTAEREGVDLRLYKVIYQAIEDVEAAMKGLLDPIFEEKVIGHAEVQKIFKASQIGNIAGAFVLDGMFQRNCKIRITRAGEQIYEGELASLKRFKDDVKEVKAGYDCGLVFEGFDQMQEQDIVEAYIMVEVPRT